VKNISIPVGGFYFNSNAKGRCVMRKRVLSFFIVGIIFFACGTVFADSCVIRWWGTCGPLCFDTCIYGYYCIQPQGWITTSQQSRTQEAALEAFNEIFGYTGTYNNECYQAYCLGGPGNDCYQVCINGTWLYVMHTNIPFDWESGGGGWDVFCGPETDTDGDGVMDIADNCPDVYNPDQVDSNSNGFGDVCEPVTTTTTTAAPPTTTVPSTTTISTTTTVPPTLVSLIDFSAIPGNRIVTLLWSTASEIDNAGFNLYCSETENGAYIKINNTLISTQGSSTQGASYEFIDKEVKNRKIYYYKLEDIDLSGKSTMHGPVSATPRWIWRIFGK
jgi:hypothetical protein